MHPSESNFKITLNSNRVIWLYEIHCSLTYGGLLEGFPNRKMNKDTILGLADMANHKIYNATKPYTIRPEETLIEHKVRSDRWPATSVGRPSMAGI